MTALRGGRRRRRPRRTAVLRRCAAAVLAVLVLAGVVLLGVMAPRASDPASAGLPAARLTTPARSAAPKPEPPPRSAYGIAAAPAAEQVSINLKAPLKSGLLFDVHSGQVLWQRNSAGILPIASLTKMMTALVVMAHAHPRDRVLITKDAMRYTGSGVGLLPKNKRVPLTPLLYGLLLPSGNDAAIALADHVAGTQSRFVAMMNDQARKLRLGCTRFSTVSGIVDRGNYSCAQDLALIAHALLEQPLLARIVGSRSAALPFPIKGGKLYLYNNNPLLLLRYPGADGVKTGYTDAAGQCLLATARHGRTWLGVVLLHSGDTYTQAQRLLNAGFAKLNRRAPANAGKS